MTPFRANLLVPPELAVVSMKRQQAGQLSDELILKNLKTFRPEQISIGRLQYSQTVMDYIAANYVRIWQSQPSGQSTTESIFLRSDLASAVPPTPPVAP
jgi:hypothetical protein